MNLSEYINTFQNRREAREKLASSIGCSEITIRSWANGNRFPHRKWWDGISHATDGKVSIADMAKH